MGYSVGRAIFLRRKQNVSPTVKKSVDKSRLGDAAKQMVSQSPSKCQRPEIRGRLGNCSRPRERRAGQLKAAGGPGRPSAIKIMLEQLEKLEQGLRIRWLMHQC